MDEPGRFTWDALGVDEGGLPVHLPMGVNEAGEGPEDDERAHHFICWCNLGCPLDAALRLASRIPTRPERKN